MVVIPFSSCDARGGQRLSAHLSSVACRMVPEPRRPVDWLARLAGLLHDIGKAREEWQRYLKASLAGEKCRPVPHAYFGAALLAPLGRWLLEEMRAWDREHQDALVRWILDVADHHGELSDLDPETKPPWVPVWNRKHLDDVDWSGVCGWLKGELPMEPPEWLEHPDTVAGKVAESSADWPFRTERVIQYRHKVLRRSEQREREACRSCLRLRTASLVAADRLDAGTIQIDRLDKDRAARAIAELENHLRKMRERDDRQAAIDELREHVRREALDRWHRRPDAPMYTLTLPTGYGKTLTALHVALEACRRGIAHRIVYVAPHVSILSQAAEQIRKATLLDVMEHHHLSVAVREDMDEGMYLVMESWQSPVVATTFHQLFRALFPRRAQHTLRLPALERAVVILDEPQMIDPAMWNVLLSMLEAAHREMGTQTLLVTATLPDTGHAEIHPPVPLAGNVPSAVRYVVRTLKEKKEDPWDEERTAQVLVERAGRHRQAAVILNTIVDAYRVYQAVRDRADIPVLFLHGLMQPVHKAHRLVELRRRLQKDEPLLVVGTPILECGLDISFPLILRALPVLPSVVQTAGRINRHGKEDRGELEVFSFRRGGEKDTRPWIYRRLEEREVTDDLLWEKEQIEEPELIRLAEAYYAEVFRRNRHRARYDAVARAAAGMWSEVAGWEPFEQSMPTRPVFIPTGGQWMDPERLERLLRPWECDGVEELYDRYMDRGFMAGLSFLERKRFLSALQSFTVAVTEEMLGRLAVTGDRVIARCSDPSLYDEDTGLAHLRDADSADAWIW